MLEAFYKGKLVLVTGDTGFKGSWLCEWLIGLGANVVGVGLPPDTNPSLYDQLSLQSRLHHRGIDIRNSSAVEDLITELQPDVVFHLAAQPLVRLSYEIPVETYATNVMGTVHVLNALRSIRKKCAAVFITTDKCYRNNEWTHGYREEDPMGGHDPYSSSKGACELAIESFRNSYFSDPIESGVAIASVRAGNVIGGGDWALDRIVPDAMRALGRGEAIPVRNPHATRPWQHVLEPLSGYLQVAVRLYTALSQDVSADEGFSCRQLCSAYNFGPSLQSNRNVAFLVEEILKNWSGSWKDLSSGGQAVHEASLLNLSSDKAYHMLGWSPRWNFAETIRATVEWYLAAQSEAFDAQAFTSEQIRNYSATAV